MKSTQYKKIYTYVRIYHRISQKIFQNIRKINKSAPKYIIYTYIHRYKEKQSLKEDKKLKN